MVGAELSMLLLSSGRVVSVDAIMHKRFPKIPLF
jgi:hypothetical protein